MEYFKLYPFDDLHRFHRPAALIASSMGGGDIGTKLDFLQPSPRVELARQEAAKRGLSEVDLQTINNLMGRR